MGNRAIIESSKTKEQVYLHWNGGRDSIEAFLRYCELKSHRGFDDSYGKARFCQVVGNYFGGTTSIGVMSGQKDCWDNGIFVVNGWKIVNRKDFEGPEQNRHKLDEMLIAINECQPVKEQLPIEVLVEKAVDPCEIKVGEQVWVNDYDGNYEKFKVVGIGIDEFINGTNVNGLPFVNQYENDGRYDQNINNYLRDPVYRAMQVEGELS